MLALAVAACSGGSKTAPRPAPPPQGTLTLVDLNVLHGFACAPDSNHCLAPDRVALFARLLEEAKCPEVVTVQEVSSWMHDLIEAARPGLCGGRYQLVTDSLRVLDKEEVLTSLPVLGQQRVRLAGPQRTAYWVRVRASLGPVDLVVTHLGAGADAQGQGGAPCEPGQCPASCKTGSSQVTCQATQVVDLLRRHRPPGGVGIVTGDFNVVAGSLPYRVLTDAGLVDTFLAAGNAECDRASGRGCTSGRDDTTVASLQDPTSRETERIDFVFLAPGRCRAQYDAGTGLFASMPTTNGPGGLAWPSDHVGAALDLRCR